MRVLPTCFRVAFQQSGCTVMPEGWNMPVCRTNGCPFGNQEATLVPSISSALPCYMFTKTQSQMFVALHALFYSGSFAEGVFWWWCAAWFNFLRSVLDAVHSKDPVKRASVSVWEMGIHERPPVIRPKPTWHMRRKPSYSKVPRIYVACTGRCGTSTSMSFCIHQSTVLLQQLWVVFLWDWLFLMSVLLSWMRRRKNKRKLVLFSSHASSGPFLWM